MSEAKNLEGHIKFLLCVVADTRKDKDVTRIIEDCIGFSPADVKCVGPSSSSGIHVVECMVDKSRIDAAFYDRLRASEQIAVISDQLSEELYPDILSAASDVENRMRQLLIYVPDMVDGYAEMFLQHDLPKNLMTRSKTPGVAAVVKSGKIDALYSKLTMEHMINILGHDLSWSSYNIDKDDIIGIIDECSTIDDVKRRIMERYQHDNVWGVISRNVLEVSVSWSNIRKELMSVKDIRNRCAHFRAVREADLARIKANRDYILSHTKLKRSISQTEMSSLAYAAKMFNKSIVGDIVQPVWDIQKILENAGGLTSIRNSVMAANNVITNAIVPNLLNSQSYVLSMLPPLGINDKNGECYQGESDNSDDTDENGRRGDNNG